ncbi:MAG TPA: tetraacyldisaccharide 4'-kinase [Thiobacillaceae bacterium]|nr:tetraacyldisaccharide 4'-kinase [Thiobacillaceae bacterium]
MRHWRSLNPVSLLLSPLAGLFWLAVSVRRWLYKRHCLRSYRLGVPVVVVGNITSGGTGKTPLIMALVKALQQLGFRPGVVSRGYGGTHTTPQLVTGQSDPTGAGDEPVLIAWKTGAPVAVGHDRVAAGRLLLAHSPGIDVILADDGLQHYRLGRDIELVVVDGSYGLGNGLLLPAGPLREPARRLQSADAVIITRRPGAPRRFSVRHPRIMEVHHGPGKLYRLIDAKERLDPQHAFSQRLTALAGIARPESFFNALENFGLDFQTRTFPDHHAYSATELEREGLLLMTEKDAVKCRKFAKPDWWVLEWEALPGPDLIAWLAETIDCPGGPQRCLHTLECHNLKQSTGNKGM